MHAEDPDGELETAALVFPDDAAGRRWGSHLVPLQMVPSVYVSQRWLSEDRAQSWGLRGRRYDESGEIDAGGRDAENRDELYVHQRRLVRRLGR